MLARVELHPMIDFRRCAEVCGLDDDDAQRRLPRPRSGYTPASPGTRASPGGVLGCDGATARTIRKLTGIAMDDLGFTERWLVIDIMAGTGLDTWDGVEQVCDPARATTFMQVTGDRFPLGVPAARR